MKYSDIALEGYIRNYYKCIDLLQSLDDKLEKEDFMRHFLNSLPNDFLPITIILEK